MDIRFARSLDRGNTWQVATINSDGTGSDQFSPDIAVDKNGKISISSYDTRLSSTSETVHVFLARSTDGNSFSSERITTASSNDSKNNPLRDLTANLGDQTAIAITDDFAVVAWTDTRLGNEDIFSSVVFDPYGAFVSGAGKINSPAGAFNPNPSVDGTAEFGFEFKYKKGSSVPSGSTDFSFALPQSKIKFRFQSTSYDSLVITGSNAQVRGAGKVNGSGDYFFVVTVTDGGQPLGGGVDRFRIKIVDKTTGVVLYDNVRGAPDQIEVAAPQAIAQGKIDIVH
jgi:hypothetical protein